MDRLLRHPVWLAIGLAAAVVAGLIAFLNGLPELVDTTIPWLANSIDALGITIGQLFASIVLALAFSMLAAVVWQTRPKPPPGSGKKRRKQLATYRAHIDTLLTWVYRRRHWTGLSTDGRYREGADWGSLYPGTGYGRS